MLTQPVVDPEPGNDVPNEEGLEAVSLANEGQDGEDEWTTPFGWVLSVNSKQSTTSMIPYPPALSAHRYRTSGAHPSSLHPPSAVPPSTALSKRVSSSVSVCVSAVRPSTPADVDVDATPCARRPSFGLSRLAVSHALSASSIAPAALLDSAWHRLLHRE